MFNDTFYPTSPKGCEALTSGLSHLRNSKVLDPSAGKGDILDYIDNHHGDRYGRSKTGLYAIEIDPQLRAILTEKGYKVVGTDFLAYPGLQYFNHILMNPPFDEGARHLLKAWDVANGAIIRCLLNSETLRNPHTQERKQLAQIVEQYGWAKELGPIFKGAERPSNVEVTLIHLQDTRKKEAYRLDFDPDTTTTYTGDFKLDEIEEKALALGDIFENYEARYMAAVAAFKEMLLARQKVMHYLSPLVNDYPSPDKLVGEALAQGKSGGISYDTFLEASNKAAWDHLFQKTKLGSVTTEGVRRELEKLQSDQGAMAFTADNMKGLFDFLFLNREQVIKQCILEVFDELTKYHKENRLYVEGWKTNTAYAVKARFILPNIGSYYHEGIDYDSARKLADIEKSLCFLSGKKFDNIWSINRAYDKENWPKPGINFPFGKPVESEFFITKLFKKRSMHFLWRDEDLRVAFNTFVAQQRWGELPEKTKAGVYR